MRFLLSPMRDRLRCVRYPVLVHEFLDDSFEVSYQGQILARFDRTARLIETPCTWGCTA